MLCVYLSDYKNISAGAEYMHLRVKVVHLFEKLKQTRLFIQEI